MTTPKTQARVEGTLDPLIVSILKERAAGSSAPNGSALPSLLAAIRECEQERLSAQMSGLETGWEHSATQSMWRRVQALAEIVIQPNAALGAR